MKRFVLCLLAFSALVAFAQSQAPSLGETISTLQEGVSNIPLEAALANIEGWRSTLESSDDPAQQIVGSQLGDLASALETTPIDAREVSSLLVGLGKSTVILGESAGEDQLVALGDLLTQAGSSASIEAIEGESGEGQ